MDRGHKDDVPPIIFAQNGQHMLANNAFLQLQCLSCSAVAVEHNLSWI